MKGKRSQRGIRTPPVRSPRDPLVYRQAREDVERNMGARLRGKTWQFLVDKGYIGKLIVGELGIDELIKEIQEFHVAFGQAIPVIGEGARMLTPEMRGASVREESISRLVAKLASRDQRVQAFRTEVLGDTGLLSWSAVEPWIFEKARIDAEQHSGELSSSWWIDDINVPSWYSQNADALILRDDTTIVPELELRLSPSKVRTALRKRYLVYSRMDDTGWRERRFQIRADGILDRLQQLSNAVAGMYGWTEAQATIFTLTGLPPFISTVVADRDIHPIPGLTRIILEVDPTLSPKEVQEKYRQVRQHLLGERHREMTDKHMRLAEFAGTEMEGAATTERMNEWNRRYPDWAYSQPRVFRQDSIGAQKRLVGVVVTRGGTTDVVEESDAGDDEEGV